MILSHVHPLLIAANRQPHSIFQRPLAASRLLARLPSVSDTEWRAASIDAVVEKWAIKFTLDLRVPKRPLA